MSYTMLSNVFLGVIHDQTSSDFVVSCIIGFKGFEQFVGYITDRLNVYVVGGYILA